MDNELKGWQGEKFVVKILEQIIKSANIHAEVYNNVILEFHSLYGVNGFMTTEIDHIVLTDSIIFILETKNEKYASGNELDNQWTLLNEDLVPNPIIQNQLHKKVLCAELGLDLKNVITIECLLEVERKNIRTIYKNDYVLSKSNIEEYLPLLLSTKTFDAFTEYDNIKEKIALCEKKSASKRQRHIENLKNAEKIEAWTKTHERHYLFSRTDSAICPLCGGNLIFKGFKGVDYTRNNKKKSQQYMVGCTNYDEKQCNYSQYYSPVKNQ